MEKLLSLILKLSMFLGQRTYLQMHCRVFIFNEAPGTVRARSEYTYHDVIDNDVLDIRSISMPVFAGREAQAMSSDRVTRSMTRALKESTVLTVPTEKEKEKA
jgi:hypothetical protein